VAKSVTREQAERKKQQAAEFMERIGEPDRADEFDSMSVEEYAEHRGLQLVATNPKRKARKKTMAASGPSKADLQDMIDRAIETLSEAYTPEASREDLATAAGEALDILNGEDEDDSTLEDADDDDSDDSDDLEDDEEGE
jgi:hypothetical protein